MPLGRAGAERQGQAQCRYQGPILPGQPPRAVRARVTPTCAEPGVGEHSHPRWAPVPALTLPPLGSPPRRGMQQQPPPPPNPLGRAICKYFPFQQLSLSQVTDAAGPGCVFLGDLALQRGGRESPFPTHGSAALSPASSQGLGHALGLASSTLSPGGGFLLRLLSRKRNRRKILPRSDQTIPPSPDLPPDIH